MATTASTRPPYRTRKPPIGSVGPTISSPSSSSSASASTSEPTSSKPSHFRITLHRSAIGLPERTGKTLEALGIHKRMQTVFHPHSSDIAGKILKVKELVEVRNVFAQEVKTAEQMRKERKAVRGYEVVKRRVASSLSSGSATNAPSTAA